MFTENIRRTLAINITTASHNARLLLTFLNNEMALHQMYSFQFSSMNNVYIYLYTPGLWIQDNCACSFPPSKSMFSFHLYCCQKYAELLSPVPVQQVSGYVQTTLSEILMRHVAYDILLWTFINDDKQGQLHDQKLILNACVLKLEFEIWVFHQIAVIFCCLHELCGTAITARRLDYTWQ